MFGLFADDKEGEKKRIDRIIEIIVSDKYDSKGFNFEKGDFVYKDGVLQIKVANLEKMKYLEGSQLEIEKGRVVMTSKEGVRAGVVVESLDSEGVIIVDPRDFRPRNESVKQLNEGVDEYIKRVGETKDSPEKAKMLKLLNDYAKSIPSLSNEEVNSLAKSAHGAVKLLYQIQAYDHIVSIFEDKNSPAKEKAIKALSSLMVASVSEEDDEVVQGKLDNIIYEYGQAQDAQKQSFEAKLKGLVEGITTENMLERLEKVADLKVSEDALKSVVIPALNRVSFPTGWEINEKFKHFEQGKVFTFGLKNGGDVFHLSVIEGGSINIGLVSSELNSMLADFSKKSLSNYLKYINDQRKKEFQIVKAMGVMQGDFERFLESFDLASLKSIEELENESQRFEDLFKNYDGTKEKYLQFVKDFYGSIEHPDPEEVHRGNMRKVKNDYDRVKKEIEARKAVLEAEAQATGENAPRKLEKRPSEQKVIPVEKEIPADQKESVDEKVISLESFDFEEGNTDITEAYKTHLKKIAEQFDPSKHKELVIEAYSSPAIKASKARRTALFRVASTRTYLMSLDTALKKDHIITKAYGTDNPHNKEGYPKGVVDFSFISK